MAFTNRQMLRALANADIDALTAIFGEHAEEVAAKASHDLAGLENRKKDNSKRRANLAVFTEKVAPYIAENPCVTVNEVRALLGEDVTSPKVGAILKAGVSEGLIVRRVVRATDNLAVKCGTYYTEKGYQFPAKAA